MNRVYVLGDIHGAWQNVRDFYQRSLKENFTRETDTLILLGDAGLNYYLGDRDRKAKGHLEKFPFTYFVIRGNHEERPSVCMAKNPDAWHIEDYWGNTVYVENDYPHIKYALDEVATYEIPINNGIVETLVVPGAYSVDKQFRITNGWSWFEGEQLSQKEMENGLELINAIGAKVDLVLSHTCPCIFIPTDLFLPQIDQNTVDKSMERYLGHIEYLIDYKCWLWGHYHSERNYPRTDGKIKIMLYEKGINLEEAMNSESVRFL